MNIPQVNAYHLCHKPRYITVPAMLARTPDLLTQFQL